MDSIFHEKQEGYLCAQHCLNALLQDQYFNAVLLAEHANQLDAVEKLAMAESGEDTDDYKRFIEQPSGNMDDSGYFSVQVISRALNVLNLELIPYNSTEPTALIAQKDPSQMKAYICNYKGHWFTIRKLGNQWFNLNSMLSGPQLISETYLSIYLAQLISEGYSIFIVIGILPSCKADEVLLKNPIVAKPKSNNEEPKLNSRESKFVSKGYRLGTKAEEKVNNLEVVQIPEIITGPSTSSIARPPEVEIISESSWQPREKIIPIKVEGRDEILTVEDDDETTLKQVLQWSLENYKKEQQNESLKLRLENPPISTKTIVGENSIDDDEDDELRRALQLSLECETNTPDQENVRWHRLNYLQMHSRGPQAENSTKLNS